MLFHKALATAALLSSFAVASPVDKRGDDPPAVTDGWKIYLRCTHFMFPDGPTGGTMNPSTEHFRIAKPDGTEIVADSCDSTTGCVFSDPELDNGSITVHPRDTPNNCEMSYSYRGHGQKMEDDNCGYDNSGFTPFASDKTAICYFEP